ncbi:MAG: hypothetical protein WDO74_09315 [Pseudomonadota bacterium]
MAAKKARKTKPRKRARRSAAKPQRSKVLRTSKPKPKPKPKSKTRRKPAPRALEIQLRKTVGELGLTEARKIFASVEAAFGD